MIAASPTSPRLPGGGPLDDLSRGSPSTPDASSPAAAPASLRAQLGATRTAAARLVGAHVNLAKAEFGEIAAEIKRFAIAAGVVLGLLLFAGMLLLVGSALFIGEWLFGSLGWGVLHGLELCVAIGVAAILGALGATRRQLGGTFLLAIVVGVVVGVVLGLDLTNQGWSRAGDNLFSGVEPGVRPLVTAVVLLGALGALIGLLAGIRAGGFGAAIAGLVGGAILGAILGAFTAIHWGSQAGGAVGVAAALIAWPVGLGVSVMRRGVDFEAIKDRLVPNETIATTRETIEWVRKQTPLGRKS